MSERNASTPAKRQASIAISFDLENVARFPRWEDTCDNYEKGRNLSPYMKEYSVEAARRVKAQGGAIHFFLVGVVLEADDEWLKEILAMGHRIGNHTYNHVNMLATTPTSTASMFRYSPWLIEGKTTSEIIHENIRLTSAAMKSRLGIDPAGFRTPGGFPDGLDGREDLQKLLLDFGFTWSSSKYPLHAMNAPGEAPTPEVLDDIMAKHAANQPYVYPTGLVEVPMSPMSDIDGFRNGRWPLETFLQVIGASVQWAIENGAVYDFLGHPACLGAVDPELKTIDLICDLVKRAGDRAALVDLDTIARQTAAMRD